MRSLERPGTTPAENRSASPDYLKNKNIYNDGKLYYQSIDKVLQQTKVYKTHSNFNRLPTAGQLAQIEWGKKQSLENLPNLGSPQRSPRVQASVAGCSSTRSPAPKSSTLLPYG